MEYIFSKEEALKFNHIIEEIYESPEFDSKTAKNPLDRLK